MPVSDTHPEYDKTLSKWTKCRVCVQGEEAVKYASEDYLPRLSGQDDTDYGAYKMRASFFAGTARAVGALVGMLFKKPERVENASEELHDILETVTEDKTDISTFAKHVAEEVVVAGRVCVLVDAASEVLNARPYLTSYVAEDVVNWKTYIDEQGERGLSLLVLRELHYEEEDEFSHEAVPQLRVLSLQEGRYTVRLYRERERPDPSSAAGATLKEYILEETVEPRVRGAALNFIPAVLIGTTDVAPDVEKPPMLDVAEVNLSLYRTSADLEHGRHFTALPTAYISGRLEDEGRPRGGLRIGSSEVWLLEEGATAGYLEFTGQGLGSLEKAVEEKKNDMAVLGARILLSDPNFQEAEGTLRMRRLGEGSIAASIASTVSTGLTKVLQWWQWWLQGKEELTLTLNTEYVDAPLDAQTLQTLMAGVMQKQISWETFYHNLKKSGLAPDERTLEEELELINSGGPAELEPPPQELPDEDEDGDEEEEEDEQEEEEDE